MSLAFDRTAALARIVAIRRAGVVARDVCRRSARGEVAAAFERSFYLRVGTQFVCLGEAAIGNGPTTLIVAARVADLGLRPGQRAVIGGHGIALGDISFDLSGCETWGAPAWPAAPSPAALQAACATIARRAATESPPDSLARVAFAPDDTPLARLARPGVAAFEAWMTSSLSTGLSARDGAVAETLAPSLPPFAKRMVGRVASEASRVGGTRRQTTDDGEWIREAHLSSFVLRRPSSDCPPPLTPPHHSLREWGEGNLEACARGLIGLGPGLTPSGDDFLMGALAALDGLGQTNMHAALGAAVVAAAGGTSPLSASLLRAAAAGHVGEKLHVMVAALLAGDTDAAIAAAARIGHTSGWDALAGAVVTSRRAQ